MKDCADFAAELGWAVPADGYLPAECCWSCHEDVEYGYPLLDPPDRTDGGVCCMVVNRFDDLHHPSGTRR